MTKQIVIDDDGHTELGPVENPPKFVPGLVRNPDGTESVKVSLYNVPELSMIEASLVSDVAHGIEPLNVPSYLAQALSVDQHLKRLTITADNGVWQFDLLPCRFSDGKGKPMFLVKLVQGAE